MWNVECGMWDEGGRMKEVAYWVRLYLRLLGAQVRAEMQYRASLIAELIGAF